MTKKLKNEIKKLPKRFMAFTMIFAMLFSYFAPITNVFALQSHGEGQHCFAFNMDDNGFPVSSVTINGAVWNKTDDHRYYSNNNVYTIVIKAGKKGDQYPWISTAGGLDNYKTYNAIENPTDDPNVIGDEYLLTLKLNNIPYEGACSNFGISLQDGPFPVLPEIAASADINITISGDELEYHYVEDKPNEADVTYFKFGINSGISDDIVPFTFGNANYVYNSNPEPNNVSSVSTKQPIQYEYDYDGTGYVTFYVNGGGTDEYTKIEINGVDYSNQAPHSQIEVFEHLNGWASVFEIKNVPYADTYNVVVEGRKVSDENTVAGLGWSYLSRERSNLPEDEAEGNFAHGRLEFVQAKYTYVDAETHVAETHVFDSVNEYNNARFNGTGQIYMWNDGRKDYEEVDRRQAWGEASIPYGTELTMRIVPDSGYQLVGLAKTPTGFTATDEVGVYKMVFTKENFKYSDGGFDLQPVFVEVGSEVNAASTNVKNGNVDINTVFENGTAKLEVNDVQSMSPERMESFENKATEENYGIEYYLDISLYNSVYKGGKKDSNGNYESWDTPVENIDNKATITLELENDMSGKNLAIVHETHNGDKITGYELIDAVYNEENNTITFETNSFSNYAIASKESTETTKYTVHFDSNGGSQVEDKEVTSGNSVAEPQAPTNGDKIFDGWYEDETLTTRFDFNTPITSNVTLYAKWIDNEESDNSETEKYTITDSSGNVISFTEEKDREFALNIIDYLTFSLEDLENAEIPKDMFDSMMEMIANATKNYGTLLSFYEIEVRNDDGYLIHEGPFNIKIKMTDEMKKYNTFKIIYVDADNNFATESPITLTMDGDYLVGTLDHLSTYALTGSNTSTSNNTNTTNNPQTGDNIYIWFGMLIISILGLSLGTFTATKFKKSKNR